MDRFKQNGHILSTTDVELLLNKLYLAQVLYRESGGVHTSVLTDGNDNYIEAEDIGRHNTLDKLAGKYLYVKDKFNPRILLTTGRISSEMLQKSSRLGVSFVISRTSPTSLSIDLAMQYGITLVGYARRNQFKVYSFPERISHEN
jgi:FdhD protein